MCCLTSIASQPRASALPLSAVLPTWVVLLVPHGALCEKLRHVIEHHGDAASGITLAVFKVERIHKMISGEVRNVLKVAVLPRPQCILSQQSEIPGEIKDPRSNNR